MRAGEYEATVEALELAALRLADAVGPHFEPDEVAARKRALRVAARRYARAAEAPTLDAPAERKVWR